MYVVWPEGGQVERTLHWKNLCACPVGDAWQEPLVESEAGCGLARKPEGEPAAPPEEVNVAEPPEQLEEVPPCQLF